jgi:hypothetical protein
MNMNRRDIFAVIACLGLFAVSSRSQSSQQSVLVFKTPTCSCCGKWVEHLKANGFDVKVQEVDNTAAYRKQYRVPRGMESCHTAVVGGYAIEGHVPAKEIKRLLEEHSKLAGLALPGMPLGSPGMEGPRSDAYSVMGFDQDGQTLVYARYPEE